MHILNVSNIIERWCNLTPQMQQDSRHIYREAMSKTDLVSQWDNMSDTQKLYLIDLYKAQRKEKYKTHKKRALAATEDKDTNIKMEKFNQRFILNVMNRYAPKGYKFVITGDNRRIAIESSEIMGNQKPRGAFISDISFDLIEGLYGSLFKNDKDTFDTDNIYWRMRGFTPEKPHRTTKEKFEQYLQTVENISRHSQTCIEVLQTKPFMPLFRKNAILVQGIMDSGKPAPKFLNDRLHQYVNSIIWWTFRRAMREVKASKLIKYRNTYKKTMNRINVIPEKRSGFTMWRDNIDLQERKKMRNRLEALQYDILPKAVEEKNHKLVLTTKQEITQLNNILGPDYTIQQTPARNLLSDVFYEKQNIRTADKKPREKVFPTNMSTTKQIWLLLTAREQKNKIK